jgi:hypothetical protein
MVNIFHLLFQVLRLLDREISPYGYNLTLKAVDGGSPARTYYKNVHVQLGDVNDHAPVFGHQERNSPNSCFIKLSWNMAWLVSRDVISVAQTYL